MIAFNFKLWVIHAHIKYKVVALRLKKTAQTRKIGNVQKSGTWRLAVQNQHLAAPAARKYENQNSAL